MKNKVDKKNIIDHWNAETRFQRIKNRFLKNNGHLLNSFKSIISQKECWKIKNVIWLIKT